jgi:hypothetical protein
MGIQCIFYKNALKLYASKLVSTRLVNVGVYRVFEGPKFGKMGGLVCDHVPRDDLCSRCPCPIANIDHGYERMSPKLVRELGDHQQSNVSLGKSSPLPLNLREMPIRRRYSAHHYDRLFLVDMKKLGAEEYEVVVDSSHFDGKVVGLVRDNETFPRVCCIGLRLHEGI